VLEAYSKLKTKAENNCKSQGSVLGYLGQRPQGLIDKALKDF